MDTRQVGLLSSTASGTRSGSAAPTRTRTAKPKEPERKGIRIVHLSTSRGSAACGRPLGRIGTEGWEAHSLARAGAVVSRRDACLVCARFAHVLEIDADTLQVRG